MNLFSFYFYLLIIIELILLSISQTSKVFPLYKVILSGNINNLDTQSNTIFNVFINIKGMGITFDQDSDVNIIPLHLFRQIEKYYRDCYADVLYFYNRFKDDYIILILSDYWEELEVVHFIMEDRGISFPLNELFKKDNEKDEYNFLFLGKENQEHIVIGKNLINTMGIEFKNNDYIIHNEDFIMKKDE